MFFLKLQIICDNFKLGKCITKKKEFKLSPESIVRGIKWTSHLKFAAEEKIRNIFEALHGEQSI